jgi:bifunctional non-homologous end joining protein LigD
VAAFSPRARPNGGVSVPLHWDELDPRSDLRARFDVRTVVERLKEDDPWSGYWTARQSITARMKKALGM